MIKATQVALLDCHIDCPLMVVKGDGTIMSAKEAIIRPIETILSGSAASSNGIGAPAKNWIPVFFKSTTTRSTGAYKVSQDMAQF